MDNAPPKKAIILWYILDAEFQAVLSDFDDVKSKVKKSMKQILAQAMKRLNEDENTFIFLWDLYLYPADLKRDKPANYWRYDPPGYKKKITKIWDKSNMGDPRIDNVNRKKIKNFIEKIRVCPSSDRSETKRASGIILRNIPQWGQSTQERVEAIKVIFA